MILIDYSAVAISSALQQITRVELSEDMLRHMVLNSIRAYNQKFSNEFGSVVIACDNKHYWRKSAYPGYKFKRKRDREESGIDWHLIFDALYKIKQEIAETFPYKVMDVPFAEADDVIGVLTKEFSDQERILIISGDKDFQQLQRFHGVQQFSPNLKRFIVCQNPLMFLQEHCIRGDDGDSIPNYLSPDDTFTKSIRQKAIMNVKLNEWLGQPPEQFCTEETLKNYRRNERLIDLDMIPGDICQAILEEYQRPIMGNRSMIYSYMIKHRMRNLLESIQEF